MEGKAGRDLDRESRWRSWMTAAQRGERASYERLLTELLPFVRGLVRGRIGDRPAVEDIVQEVLLSIHTARHTYRAERPFSPWVRAIARNAVTDWGRREARRSRRELALEAVEIPAAEPSQEPATKVLSPALRRALAALPEPQRQAVLLLKVEGLSVAEAARHVGISPGALKLRAHRAYRGLRTLLGRDLL
jgi:RNA polymerase sigma-70 factor (ECF subfamily)